MQFQNPISPLNHTYFSKSFLISEWMDSKHKAMYVSGELIVLWCWSSVLFSFVFFSEGSLCVLGVRKGGHLALGMPLRRSKILLKCPYCDSRATSFSAESSRPSDSPVQTHKYLAFQAAFRTFPHLATFKCSTDQEFGLNWGTWFQTPKVWSNAQSLGSLSNRTPQNVSILISRILNMYCMPLGV